MVLYGRTGDRADMVYGNDFEYDQSAGEVRALGLVHIDLGAAGSASRALRRPTPRTGRRCRRRTPGCCTPQPAASSTWTSSVSPPPSEAIEFRTGQMTGHAVGADYSTDTGILLLHSAVKMCGVSQRPSGKPVCRQRAARSPRSPRHPRRARYVSAEETMQADEAILHTRADNSFERIEAEGNIRTGIGAPSSAARADLALTEKNKLQTALSRAASSTRRTSRSARRAARPALQVAFDARAHRSMPLLRLRPPDGAHPPRGRPEAALGLTRSRSRHVDTTMVPAAKGKSALRDAHASGSAHLTLVESAPGFRAQAQRTWPGTPSQPTCSRDRPRATPRYSQRPRTHLLRQLTAEGVEQTSSGDTLDARFQPSGAAQAPAPPIPA